MRQPWEFLSIAKNLRAAVLGIVVIVVSSPGVGTAGPPLITDDPETPGRGGWEINISHNIERTRNAFLMETPLFDINSPKTRGSGSRERLRTSSTDGPYAESDLLAPRPERV